MNDAFLPSDWSIWVANSPPSPLQPQLLSSSSRKIPGSVCSEGNTFCLLSTVTCLLLLYRLSFGLFATVCHTIYGLRSRLLLTPASNLV